MQKPCETNRPLYEATLPVYVFKDSSNNQVGEPNYEAKLYMIKVSISGNSTYSPSTVLSNTTSSTLISTKKNQSLSNSLQNINSLIFTLTDESDLYFLYTAQIDENGYRNLKLTQRIKTDFSQFSSHLEQMFILCSQSHTENKQE